MWVTVFENSVQHEEVCLALRLQLGVIFGPVEISSTKAKPSIATDMEIARNLFKDQSVDLVSQEQFHVSL